jgi:hypothetical protein
MATEEEVRRWVREERAAIKAEEQAACSHAISGTLHPDETLTCDQCGKVVTLADADKDSGVSLEKNLAYAGIPV